MFPPWPRQVLERIDTTNELGMHGADGTNLSWMQVKAMYRSNRPALPLLPGKTS